MRQLKWVLPALTMLCMVSLAQAGDCGWSRSACCPAPCTTCCTPCAPVAQPCYQEVQRTVMVPQMVTERRLVTCTEYQHQQQERTVTVCRPVWRSPA